jgi:hypothetical protein
MKMNREIDPKLLEKLADELVEMHNATGIELEYWDTARKFVEHFYEVTFRVAVGYKI